MGAGIAHAFLMAGSQVILVEGDGAAAEQARRRVQRSVTTAAERGVEIQPEQARRRVQRSVTTAAERGVEIQPEQVLARLRVSADPADLARVALVVEAVPEDLAVKRDVLRQAAEAAPGAFLATNTSSLSIDAVAESLPDRSRLIGLHFFNPVPASDLVEVVVGERTSAELVEAARGWVAGLGKQAIIVRDSPGFASSRLGVAIALEAIRMLEEGVASADDIDTAMTLGYRHPVGPLRTTDLVGLDVRLAIAEHLERELGPRFAPPQLLRDKVAAGHVGRKSGRGFYDW
jgi:3-hydroxybutyryl-CoA dehydrogenase